MNLKIGALLSAVLFCAASGQGRISDPYPVAVLRQGDVYLLKAEGDLWQMTRVGDVKSLCWLDQETLCLARELRTGLKNRPDWQGIEVMRDLFTLKITSGNLEQFTMDHFVCEPAPGHIPNRALFTHPVEADTMQTEIWETLRPLLRNRSLGIRGYQPDSSPDKKWTAATLGRNRGGIGLYHYPASDSYRKIEGPYWRPRFSPNNQLLAYLNAEPGQTEMWGYVLPDGEPQLFLRLPEGFEDMLDFGWTADASGFILLLSHNGGQRDIYYYEIQTKKLTPLSESGDIDQASAWH